MTENQRAEDEKWMRRALEISGNGAGYVNPNPLVGAVVIKDGEVIGEGWHQYCGGLHAERNALKNCQERGNDPAGATIYVTLEPCCHYGKTPPCTEAIMEKGLARVVFGAWDPNPLVAGKGIQILKDAGIETEGPVLEQECLRKNEIFFHYITTGTPYVIMKYAMTADGKIAAYTGDSRWVTGEAARRHTHVTRKRVSAIMVGIGTVLADDPMLNCRLDGSADTGDTLTTANASLTDKAYDGLVADEKEIQKLAGHTADPVRIICDSHLRIPLDSQIVNTASDIRTIVVYAGAEAVCQGTGRPAATQADSGIADTAAGRKAAAADSTDIIEKAAAGCAADMTYIEAKVAALNAAGAEVLMVPPDAEGHVDIAELMKTLGEMKIDSVLVEGGSQLHFSVLKAGVVSKVQVYMAPKLVGGALAKTPVGGEGIAKMADAVMLSEPEISIIGEDILIEYDIKK